MGNEISTSTTAVMAHASNAHIKFALSTEILFEILAFVKFYEAPNIFLINRYLLQICQVYFHSGTVGQNKKRIVRNLKMQLRKGSLAIFVKRNNTFQSVPVPEVDPPKILKAFGYIKVKKCCQIQAMEFLNKFSSLLTSGNNSIFICAHNFLLNTANAIADESEKQINSNSPNSVVVDEKQFFLNWIGQKKLYLELKFNKSFEGVGRCLTNVPLIAQFNGRLCMTFENERNLCGLEEDAKLIYGWISSAGARELQIRHYDAQKALELASQISLLFEQAHVNKIDTEKMDLAILLPRGTVMPMHSKKICNEIGDQLAMLHTFSAKCNNGIETSAYLFYTKSVKYCYENKEEMGLITRKAVYFS